MNGLKNGQLLEEEAETIGIGTPSRREEADSCNHQTRGEFAMETAVLMIGKPANRMVCHHLGIIDPKKAVSCTTSQESLIGMLYCQTIDDFMRDEGYVRIGEEDFDNNGNRVPPTTATWKIKNKSHTFITQGQMFFVPKTGGKKTANVIVQVWFYNGFGNAQYWALDAETADYFRRQHAAFCKRHNALRGAKLRNVNILNGTFEEVPLDPTKNWHTFYYPKTVVDLFEQEVFAFLHNTAEFNRHGINGRGVMLYGPPGTGKTSIGHICNNRLPETTVLWVTADSIAENEKGTLAVKKMYMLGDYVSPCVVYLEDLDLFCEDRDGRTNPATLGTLMNILDGVNSIPNVVTIGTTNRLELIENALRNRPGRFDRVLRIGVMEAGDRRRMFTDRLSNCEVGDGVIEYLVNNSDGWVGATMQEFVKTLNITFITNKTTEERVVSADVAKECVRTLKRGILEVEENNPMVRRRKSGFGGARDEESDD
jgi:predicted AAA+ superfamily ATPase